MSHPLSDILSLCGTLIPVSSNDSSSDLYWHLSSSWTYISCWLTDLSVFDQQTRANHEATLRQRNIFSTFSEQVINEFYFHVSPAFWHILIVWLNVLCEFWRYQSSRLADLSLFDQQTQANREATLRQREHFSSYSDQCSASSISMSHPRSENSHLWNNVLCDVLRYIVRLLLTSYLFLNMPESLYDHDSSNLLNMCLAMFFTSSVVSTHAGDARNGTIQSRFDIRHDHSNILMTTQTIQCDAFCLHTKWIRAKT